MDVRMPDGVVVQNVPDDISQSELLALYNKSKTPSGPQTMPSLVGPDLGWGKSLAVGAGRTVDRLIAGGKQMVNAVTGDAAANEALAKEQAFKDAAYKPLENRQPVKLGLGEGLPAAIASAPFTGGLGPLGTIGMGALTSALPEALSYGTPEERLARALKAAAAGAAGTAVGVGATKLLQPFSAAKRLPGQAMDAADNLNVRLTAGEVTQNPALQNLENWLSRTPGYSGKMADLKAANQAALNSTAARAMGQTADNLGEDVFAAANSRLGSEFTRLSRAASPDAASQPFMDALTKVDATNLARKSYIRADIAKQVDKGLELAAQGKVSGEAYQAIRSELGSAAQSAYKSGDSTLGEALKTIQKGLDEAANDSLSAADREAYALARKQWAAYKTLTKGAVSEGGNVSPARLASAMRTNNPDAFRRGAVDSPLMDIARLGEAVKGTTNPNSGNLVASQMIFGNPLTGLPTMAGNALLGATYMSRPVQGYLSSGLLSPQLERAMLRASVPAGLLGASAVQQ